ncbi:uncharacterized protein LOC134785118 [Penaeus indicus]|uniref:uncharacterized protein LOC134785118 n=1 Tax=Penaeus indicus TaxID=29960 RepID=UPI00300D37FD
MVEASNLTEDMKDPDKVWDALETRLKPKTNKYVERLHFRRFFQRENESSDEFLNRCKAQAKRCKFTETEHEPRVIEQFMNGIYNEDLQRSLIIEGEDIRLSKAIDIARSFEAFDIARSFEAIDFARSFEANIRDKRDVRAKMVNYESNVDALGYQNFALASKPCSKCGRAHNKYPPQSCPAYGTSCKMCGKMNHWQKMCRSIPENKKKTYKSKSPGQSQYAGNKVHRNFNSDKSKNANSQQWTTNILV